MVLESIIFPKDAEREPWKVFFVGFLFTVIAMFIAYKIFLSFAGLVLVFLIVMAAIPLVHKTMRYEEKKDLFFETEQSILKEHSKAIGFLLFFFLGVTIATFLTYVLLPQGVIEKLFGIQMDTISTINGNITGNAISQDSYFMKVLLNNMKVLAFCIALSFIYGVGSIFILTWNATVVGVAIGNYVRTRIAGIYADFGIVNAATYFQVVHIGLLRYALHGFFEILAYFIAGLAGSIISFAIVRQDFRTKKFEKVLVDTADLLLISIVILVFGAFVEAFITPFLFPY